MAGQQVIVSVLSDIKNFSKGMSDVAGKASATFKKVGVVAGAGLLAAGAAVGKLTKSVIDAYAAYEQNIGGIETLFKDSAGKMQQYAANAYKTAGLSANEYMSQVTSFSSSLLQGLGGDTDKAASVANRAMTDMSDNANKFGTDIGLVQNAYQGFAKQNYTMLDNLKLGYGGTQSEMARLINDSGVLGKGMEVTAQTVKDVSYDKIIEAIGVVQAKMGVTGTTAREAASTISGSIGMLQGAWTNLLTGMGDSDAKIGKLVQNVGDSLKTVVGNITPVVRQVLSTLPQVLTMLVPLVLALVPDLLNAGTQMVTALSGGIVSALPGLVAQVVPLLLTFVNSLLAQLPMILDAGVQVLLALVNGLTAAIPQLVPTIVSAVLKIVDTLLDNLDLIVNAGIGLIVTLALALIGALPKLAAKVPQIVTKIVTVLLDNLPRIIDAGVTLLLALVENLPAIISGIVSQLPKIIDAIVKGIVKAVPKLKDAGVRLLQGLWSGMSSMAGWLKDRVVGLAGDVTRWIKNAFGIQSPSRVFAGIGEFLVRGLGLGVTGNLNIAKSAMARLSDVVTTGFDPSLSMSTDFAAASAGNTYRIDVAVPVNADASEVGRQIVKAIKAYESNGGRQ